MFGIPVNPAGGLYAPAYFRRVSRTILGTESERLADAFTMFADEARSEIALDGLVAEHGKNGNSPPKRLVLRPDVKDYQLPYVENFAHRQRKSAWFDGTFGFCLYKKGLFRGEDLAALITFSEERGGILVQQIQGMHEERNVLRRFKWERALLTYVMGWAGDSGIPAVRVQSVANNQWARKTLVALKKAHPEAYAKGMTLEEASRMRPEQERQYLDELRRRERRVPREDRADIHLLPVQGFMVYDVTARRLGFKKDDDGNYYKRLDKRALARAA